MFISLQKGAGVKIISINAREIYDSRGVPTIECTLELENSTRVSASVPTGASRGSHEAFELRDGGLRLMGMGVQKAVRMIETIIGPELLGRQADLIEIDKLLIELDGTENKSRLGANTILAVSIAACRAQAISQEIELYEFIAHVCNFDVVSLAHPMFNMINGGAHASNKLMVQEFMVIPIGINSFSAAMECGAVFFQLLKKRLQQGGYSTAVGDEGGFAPHFESEQQALDMLMEIAEYVHHEFGWAIMLALDIAATQFYDKKRNSYIWHGKHISRDDLIEWYLKLTQNYPLYAIEDGLQEDDFEGWEILHKELGNRIAIVGDDLFVTNVQRIYEGIDRELANAVLIKPNQIGTVTETLQAIKLCKEHHMNIVISQRSGETNDSFIADLAVGTSAGQIKAGGLSRGERLAKYNRLLEIETQLLGMMNQIE